MCAVESLFVQVTVVPTGTSSWDGLNALFPRVDAPMGIVIGVEPGVGVGVGDGVGTGDGAEYPPPHALASRRIADAKIRRVLNIAPLIQPMASTGANHRANVPHVPGCERVHSGRMLVLKCFSR